MGLMKLAALARRPTLPTPARDDTQVDCVGTTGIGLEQSSKLSRESTWRWPESRRVRSGHSRVTRDHQCDGPLLFALMSWVQGLALER
jgi:hypothetical protein